MSQLSARVPVGFRFHPTDEELVGYYLPKKVGARKIDLDLIRDLDLYKLEPWDLQELCKMQADASEKQTDYYFFSRKDKKYPTGNRANRATTQGFWKATGRDKPIHAKLHTLIGMRKTLVFYQGRAPHGVKTDWIMHEFRLDDGPGRPAHEDGGWVVCRVFKKNKNLKTKMLQERAVSFEEQMGLLQEPDILSSGARFVLPDHHQYHVRDASRYGSSIKRELINLDEYNPQLPDQYLHSISLQHDLGLCTKVESSRHSMPSSSDQTRSYLTRADDHVQFYTSYPENSTSGTLYSDLDTDHAPTSSGSDVGTETTCNHEEMETISGLESVDWNALLQEPLPPAGLNSKEANSNLLRGSCPPSKLMNGDDVSVLLQLKRQNSDLFSSLELWNYTQVAQQM